MISTRKLNESLECALKSILGVLDSSRLTLAEQYWSIGEADVRVRA